MLIQHNATINRALIVSGLFWLALPVYADKCPATPAMHSGTHYQVVTTHKVNMGKGLHVTGIVRSAGDCTPLTKAKISRWQTNNDGFYVDNLYAYMYSDSHGQFAYDTQWPGAPIAHIHFIIEAPGYQKLVTQWIGHEKTDNISLEFNLLANE